MPQRPSAEELAGVASADALRAAAPPAETLLDDESEALFESPAKVPRTQKLKLIKHACACGLKYYTSKLRSSEMY